MFEGFFHQVKNVSSVTYHTAERFFTESVNPGERDAIILQSLCFSMMIALFWGGMAASNFKTLESGVIAGTSGAVIGCVTPPLGFQLIKLYNILSDEIRRLPSQEPVVDETTRLLA